MKKRICGYCNTEWQPVNTGQCKRNNSCCDECYPYVRKASNLLAASKERAEKEGLPHDLTHEYILDKLYRPCPRTGVRYELNATGRNYKDRHPRTPSVDKIEQRLGYVESNVQIVCWWYNLSKALFTDEEVLDFCKQVVESSHKDPVLPVEAAMQTPSTMMDTPIAIAADTMNKR